MTVEIFVNGVAQQVKHPCSILELLTQLQLTTQRLAVEVNLTIVPRSQFEHYQLSAGDKIEIVHAIGGG